VYSAGMCSLFRYWKWLTCEHLRWIRIMVSNIEVLIIAL
jgi:hypothetical protein